MNRRIMLLVAGIVLFCCRAGIAQINLSFIKHLSKQQLHREHLAYLSQLDPSADSTRYLYSKFHLQYFNDSLFLASVQKDAGFFLQDTLATNYAGLLFLKADNSRRDDWFRLTANRNTGFYSQQAAAMYLCMQDPLHTDINTVPEDLRRDFAAYKKSYRKKPGLAAGLSALLPGAGQLYIGRTHSFVPTLVAHLFYGLQSYESIKKQGIRSPLSILNLGAFTVFYASNIYGSYKDARQSKHEKKQQFLLHASDYYTRLAAPALY